MKLHQLKAKYYRAFRYEEVTYYSQHQVKLDVVVHHEPHYEETWYLLSPVELRQWLSPEQVVRLYRERMHIE